MSRVAVVGSGYWGKHIVRNFQAIESLGAICDEDPRVLAAFQERYPDTPTFVDFQEMVSRDDLGIEAVAIATPAETHGRLAKAALLSGKHVFVEKPLALSEAEGAALVELAGAKGKTLMVGHVLQYHAAVRKLKSLVDTGELGKIHYIYSNRLNIGKIRTEENILWSFAPHDISVMLMLLGEEPKSVTSRGGNYLQHDVADVTMTQLEFPSGVRGHIFVSWLHPIKEQKLVVVGSKRMAVFDDTSDEKLRLYSHTIEWRERQPVAQKAEPEVIELDLVEPLREECQHFVDCFTGGSRPLTDGDEGLRVLRVLSACEQSLRQGGSPVKLDALVRAATVSDQAFVHPASFVDDDVSIGAGTKIWHFSHVLSHCSIGKDCSIGQNVVIGPDVKIGDGCKIQNNVSVYKGVTLEDDVFCGPSMVFTNVHNPRAAIRRMDELRPTLVKRGASIGANATVVCGVTIGRHSFVGAGAVVTRDVPDHALVLGNPGRRVAWMCACGVRLSANLECAACGSLYAGRSEDDSEIGPRIEE